MSQQKNNRNGLLARIHILANELGMNKDDYRDMLEDRTGKRSASDLNTRQLLNTVNHLKNLIDGPTKQPLERNPGESPQMMKIKAMLMAGGKSTAYGDGIARKICKVDRLEWVPEEDLYKIITALKKQGQRKNWNHND